MLHMLHNKVFFNLSKVYAVSTRVSPQVAIGGALWEPNGNTIDSNS